MTESIMIKKIVQSFMEAFVAITPKFNWCVLRGFPDYDDNCLSIYDRLPPYQCDKVIWVVSDVSAARPFSPRRGTYFVKRGSFLDYFYSSLSKYLFITHGHFLQNIPRNQLCVNLWHGIPYKVIGQLDGKPGRRDSLVVATSELTRAVFAKVFGVSPGAVVVTGQARTDRMFVDRLKMRDCLDLRINEKTKIFLWLPTYRKSDAGERRTDGRDSGNVFNCEGFPAADFDAYLKANNAVCLVKPHPMASQRTEVNGENLLYIDDAWLRRSRLTLYQLAGLSDSLISDISSIVVDFMLLDRPMVLLFQDINEYRDSRGFVFFPIEEWLPARVNTNYAGFIDDVTAVLSGEDRYLEKRNGLKKNFFAHHDAQAAERILDHAFRVNTAIPSAEWQKVNILKKIAGKTKDF